MDFCIPDYDYMEHYAKINGLLSKLKLTFLDIDIFVDNCFLYHKYNNKIFNFKLIDNSPKLMI